MAGVTKKGELVKVGEVGLELPKTDQEGSKVPVPPMFQGAAMREAPGLSPTVVWKQVGEWFCGRYLGQRDAVGPNNSRLYDLAHYKSGEVTGVWGGTILDRKIDSLQPQRGMVLLIQYVGDVVTKRGLNPAKDFRVAEVSGQKVPA